MVAAYRWTHGPSQLARSEDCLALSLHSLNEPEWTLPMA